MLLMMLCGLWSRLMYGPRLTQAVMRCRVTGQEAVADYPVAMLN